MLQRVDHGTLLGQMVVGMESSDDRVVVYYTSFVSIECAWVVGQSRDSAKRCSSTTSFDVGSRPSPLRIATAGELFRAYTGSVVIPPTPVVKTRFTSLSRCSDRSLSWSFHLIIYTLDSSPFVPLNLA